MSSISTIRSMDVTVQVDSQGAIEDGRIAIWRRTVAMWLIWVAQRLLRSRLHITIRTEK